LRLVLQLVRLAPRHRRRRFRDLACLERRTFRRMACLSWPGSTWLLLTASNDVIKK
jgi:hypothetical protein